MREFKNDCFAMYEHGGFLERFNSPYDDQGEHNGMAFKVLNRATEKDFDLEVMPIWHVEFENGDKAYCYPEEICKVEKAEKAESPVEKTQKEEDTKYDTIYLTVRIDISYPANMNKQEARCLAYENFDYDFKLFNLASEQGMKVEGTELCDINN